MVAVTPIYLGSVQLPDSHPRASEGACPIFSFAIDHPEGLLVVDTGPGMGHPVIDELYSPDVISIIAGLNRAGFDERDVGAIVNTHLHFDHCGQNDALPHAPIWVTAAEVEASRDPHYTVAEWAEVPDHRRRLASDGEEIAPGITAVFTPGHTPGHQSVLVDTDGGRELIVGQACYRCAEFASGELAESDMHSPDWINTGNDSLRRLQALNPDQVYFSHENFHPELFSSDRSSKPID